MLALRAPAPGALAPDLRARARARSASKGTSATSKTMTPLPAKDLRSNIATWAVPTSYLPSVAKVMLDLLPTESFDPDFQGQALTTTYFDSRNFDLYKARARKSRYIVVRIRHYQPSDTYALSTKTEDQKLRVEIEKATAELILRFGLPYPGAYDLLPADLQARTTAIVADGPLVPITTVRFCRHAVEDKTNRLTLDSRVATDHGKTLTANVLEQKSTARNSQPYSEFQALGLQPIKLSKFLWSSMF